MLFRSEKGTVLPFDIKDSRTIFFTDDMLGVEELKETMTLFMDGISYDIDHMDNPIYHAQKYGKLLKDTQGTNDNQILQLLMKISNQVSENRDYNYINTSKINTYNNGSFDYINYFNHHKNMLNVSGILDSEKGDNNTGCEEE